MDEAWSTITQIVGWLDASSTQPPGTETLLRIMKITEEAAEVTQAVSGTIGPNPRVTHTWDDVQAELCDVTQNFAPPMHEAQAPLPLSEE